MSLIAGFGLFLFVGAYLILTSALNLHKHIALAASIFYISEVKEETHKKQSVNVRVKSEFGTRTRLKAPNLNKWMCSRNTEQMKFVDEATQKLSRRLDLNRFLHE
jgi:hypothetical protein